MEFIKRRLRRSYVDENKNQVLEVSVQRNNNELSIKCGSDLLVFNLNNGDFTEKEEVDFAVWVCLPIAMHKAANLLILGKGSNCTKKNAERLTDIWSSWLPEKYSMVNVDFTEVREIDEKKASENKVLMCFSGGVDSTYSLINYEFNGVKPDLLTLQGMDYPIDDSMKFNQSINKTEHLVSGLVNKRFFVASNAYDVYRRYKIKTSHSYIFLLSTVANYLSNNHSHWVLAADHAWYQQFEAFPYGSTFATNRYFDTGDFKLITHGEDVTRSEKLFSISSNIKALKSISFCKDKKIRPENCGVCPKCLRTKFMFLASVGKIPEGVFLDPITPENSKIKFSNNREFNQSYIKDTYKTAYRNNNLQLVPDIVREYKKIF